MFNPSQYVVGDYTPATVTGNAAVVPLSQLPPLQLSNLNGKTFLKEISFDMLDTIVNPPADNLDSIEAPEFTLNLNELKGRLRMDEDDFFMSINISLESAYIRRARGFVMDDAYPISLVCDQLQLQTGSRYFVQLYNDVTNSVATNASVGFSPLSEMPDVLRFKIGCMGFAADDTRVYHPNVTRIANGSDPVSGFKIKQPYFISQRIEGISLRLNFTPKVEVNVKSVYKFTPFHAQSDGSVVQHLYPHGEVGKGAVSSAAIDNKVAGGAGQGPSGNVNGGEDGGGGFNITVNPRGGGDDRGPPPSRMDRVASAFERIDRVVNAQNIASLTGAARDLHNITGGVRDYIRERRERGVQLGEGEEDGVRGRLADYDDNGALAADLDMIESDLPEPPSGQIRRGLAPLRRVDIDPEDRLEFTRQPNGDLIIEGYIENSEIQGMDEESGMISPREAIRGGGTLSDMIGQLAEIEGVSPEEIEDEYSEIYRDSVRGERSSSPFPVMSNGNHPSLEAWPAPHNPTVEQAVLVNPPTAVARAARQAAVNSRRDMSTSIFTPNPVEEHWLSRGERAAVYQDGGLPARAPVSDIFTAANSVPTPMAALPRIPVKYDKLTGIGAAAADGIHGDRDRSDERQHVADQSHRSNGFIKDFELATRTPLPKEEGVVETGVLDVDRAHLNYNNDKFKSIDDAMYSKGGIDSISGTRNINALMRTYNISSQAAVMLSLKASQLASESDDRSQITGTFYEDVLRDYIMPVLSEGTDNAAVSLGFSPDDIKRISARFSPPGEEEYFTGPDVASGAGMSRRQQPDMTRSAMMEEDTASERDVIIDKYMKYLRSLPVQHTSQGLMGDPRVTALYRRVEDKLGDHLRKRDLELNAIARRADKAAKTAEKDARLRTDLPEKKKPGPKKGSGSKKK